MDLLLIGGSRGQILELFEQGADPPQVLDHGATLGLGGVGGQHRGDAQILERGRIHVQGVDRVLHRLARTGATRQDAQTLALLGQVHQLEVAGERADHVFGACHIELIHEGDDRGPAGRRGRAPERDRREAERFHLGEQRGAAALGDRVAEHRREQANVTPELRGGGPLSAARRSGRAGGHAVVTP